VAWKARYRTWGNTALEEWDHQYARYENTVEDRSQNIRLQGQSLDTETGLHYNTFRYYDPDIGRFATQDPIGLLGGLNFYQYAPNPLQWIDPWGWASTPLNQPGYTVYGLYHPGESSEPYYVGHTNQGTIARGKQHEGMQRLQNGDTIKLLKKDLTYS
jgi:RHS repeat-associated protein